MTKQPVGADEVSFVARRVIGPPPRLHKAFASTGAVCTASAARMPGTIVNEVCRATADGSVRIGHPSGVFPSKIAFDANGRLAAGPYTHPPRRISQGEGHGGA